MPAVIHILKSIAFNDGLITKDEEIWVKMQPFLLERGYKLRPRYDPNWKPSWLSRPPSTSTRLWKYPDSITLRIKGMLLDAIRISDGAKVVLKIVVTSAADIPILEYLRSPALLADPRNHTVPILDIISFPKSTQLAWIVMPRLLHFHSAYVPFRHVSEVVEALTQFLEGLEFMHEQRIAHRDACDFNLMMDASKILPRGCHFVEKWRTEDTKSPIRPLERRRVRPVRYFFIDFETAVQYPADEETPRCVGMFGQVRDVPEMSKTVPYDPFKLDVYQLGSAISQLFEMYEGLEFLKPLVDAMTVQNPDERLTAAESHRMFRDMVSGLSRCYMSRRIWPKDATKAKRCKIWLQGNARFIASIVPRLSGKDRNVNLL